MISCSVECSCEYLNFRDLCGFCGAQVKGTHENIKMNHLSTCVCIKHSRDSEREREIVIILCALYCGIMALPQNSHDIFLLFTFCTIMCLTITSTSSRKSTHAFFNFPDVSMAIVFH